MAHSSTFTAMSLIFLLCLATFVSNLEGRKLLMATEEYANKKDTGNSIITVPLFASKVFSALPKGTVPSFSAPSKKCHATLENEQLFQRHLASLDRILQSVPSPGVGH